MRTGHSPGTSLRRKHRIPGASVPLGRSKHPPDLKQVSVRLLKRITRVEGTLVFGQQPISLERLSFIGGHPSAPRADDHDVSP